MSLFQELKRRKVVRTTVAYLAGAFITAQVIQLLVEGLGLPVWILRAVLVVLFAALPLVVGLAWAFDLTPEGVELTGKEPSQSKVALPWQRIALPVTASVLVLLASIAFLSLNRIAAAPLNANLVAVMPFHVSGDPQIAYLGEGMVDLLAAKLTGEGGPRAADPRAVISAVKKAAEDDVTEAIAVAVARQLGAGQVLIGSVVGTPRQFTINGRIVRVPGGKVIVEGNVVGSADSLLVTVDRLVAKLLALQAGEGPQRLELLTTTSLPALRAYLDARAAYRHGEFGAARDLFVSAIEEDSTFVLAAMGVMNTSGWGEGARLEMHRFQNIVANHKGRLAGVDRAIANAMVGAEWPKQRSFRQRIADWQAAVQAAPDRPDAWFWYGDVLFHWGMSADHMDAGEIADKAFSRVLELDSTYMPALGHRIDGAIRFDRDAVLRQLEVIRRRSGSDPLYQRAPRIRALGDTAALAAERAALDTMGVDRLRQVAYSAGLAGTPLEPGLRAVDLLMAKAATPDDRVDAGVIALEFALNGGMQSRAEKAYDYIFDASGEPVIEATYHLMNVLYWDADPAAGEPAAAQLARLLPGEKRTRWRVWGLCSLEQWRLWQSDTQSYSKSALELARVPGDEQLLKGDAEVCVQMLAVIHAMTQQESSLPARVQALNALLRDAPPQDNFFRTVGNIVLARAAERAGDRVLAYRAIRRSTHGAGDMPMLSTILRETGRLAALNGDREAAIRAYRKYLDMRQDAEPGVRREDDAVRKHLAELTGEK